MTISLFIYSGFTVIGDMHKQSIGPLDLHTPATRSVFYIRPFSYKIGLECSTAICRVALFKYFTASQNEYY